MRPFLLVISITLPIVPFIILLGMGDALLGLFLIAVLLIVGLLGILTNNLHYESWLSLILTSIISLVSQGYIPYVFHIALAQITNKALYNGSIVLPEYSLIISYFYKSYMKYTREFGKKGFDEVEYNKELNALITWTTALITAALVVSLALYYLITKITYTVLDPFTALLLLAITYIIIHRYIMSKVRSS
ncbi:MAG: hypothetical protein TU36_003020 [Vulcanisaeta sp. AZ3]|nr:MAG: hypothetical protein TU36_02605 [Vulcanisaeta sp. AZ3]